MDFNFLISPEYDSAELDSIELHIIGCVFKEDGVGNNPNGVEITPQYTTDIGITLHGMI